MDKVRAEDIRVFRQLRIARSWFQSPWIRFAPIDEGRKVCLEGFQSPWIRFAPRSAPGGAERDSEAHVSIPVDKVRALTIISLSSGRSVSIPVDKVRVAGVGNNARLVVRLPVSIPVDKVRAVGTSRLRGRVHGDQDVSIPVDKVRAPQGGGDTLFEGFQSPWIRFAPG